MTKCVVEDSKQAGEGEMELFSFKWLFCSHVAREMKLFTLLSAKTGWFSSCVASPPYSLSLSQSLFLSLSLSLSLSHSLPTLFLSLPLSHSLLLSLSLPVSLLSCWLFTTPTSRHHPEKGSFVKRRSWLRKFPLERHAAMPCCKKRNSCLVMGGHWYKDKHFSFYIFEILFKIFLYF